MIRYAVLGSGSSANSYIIQYNPLKDSDYSDSSRSDNLYQECSCDAEIGISIKNDKIYSENC